MKPWESSNGIVSDRHPNLGGTRAIFFPISTAYMYQFIHTGKSVLVPSLKQFTRFGFTNIVFGQCSLLHLILQYSNLINSLKCESKNRVMYTESISVYTKKLSYFFLAKLIC